MENPNVALLFEALAAYQGGDEKRLRELFDPGIEVVGGAGLINSGTYHGYSGFREWIRGWEDAWDKVDYEVREVTELTDSVAVIAVYTVGTAASSGITIDSVFGWLGEIIDGRVTRFHVYVTLNEAMAVAGDLVEARR